MYEEICKALKDELYIELGPGDLLTLSFPYKNKDELLVTIFTPERDEGESYVYSIPDKSFNFGVVRCETDTEIELCVKGMRRDPLERRFTAAQARAVAEDWENNNIAECVESALRVIQERAEGGYFKASLPNPLPSKVNWDGYVEVMKCLDYTLASHDMHNHVWEW